MPNTYEPISTQTLASAVADVFFTSIPQTYTDLVLVMTGGCTINAGVGYRLNSVSTSLYGITYLEGASAATSSRDTSTTYMRVGSNPTWSTTASNLVTHFHNYSNTTTFKSATTRINDLTNNATGLSVATFRSTSAITSINIMTSNGTTFLVGSVFTLYGIKAA